MAIAVTFPGKIGDAILQYPAPFHHWRNTGEKFIAVFDKTLQPLESLFRAQPAVEDVVYETGVQNYTMGGQPYDFGKDDELKERYGRVFHMGFREFPHAEITVHALRHMPVAVKWDDLVNTQAFCVGEKTKQDRLVIHGSLFDHCGRTPGMWEVLYQSKEFIGNYFKEIVFVGSQKERTYALSLYPEWGEFDDGNDFLVLGKYLQDSRMVFGGGSCVVALAGGLHVPSVRIHDHVQGTEVVKVWSNVAPKQLNIVEHPQYNAQIFPEFCSHYVERKHYELRSVR
jgi:hypothetical protein